MKNQKAPPSRLLRAVSSHSIRLGRTGPLLIASLVLALSLLGPQSTPAQEYPRPVGFVNDFADVIPADVRAKIEAIAGELEEKTGSELVVVTIQTTGGIDIHDYSVELFTRWGIGKKGRDNGLLIIAAVNDKQLWIKTGYGLEEVVPDAVASQVYRNVIRPLFKEGKYGEGLLSAVQILASRIASNEGAELTSVGKVPVVPAEGVERKNGRPFIPLALVLAIIILLIITRVSGGPRSRRLGGFPFWTIGGFTGGMRGGGFGGGFGGFGGGSCGGGGAGGGW